MERSSVRVSVPRGVRWWLAGLPGCVAVVLVFLLARVAAAQGAPPEVARGWTADAAAWLVSDVGRIACAAIIYAVVALMKLLPLKAASGGAKVAAVLALSLSAGAAAWGAAASLAASLGTAAAAAAGAIGLHETLGKVVATILPFVALIPRVGPAIATVLRALVAPTAPTVDEMAADRAAAKVVSP